MTTHDRWQDWLHRAKERAALMEHLCPLTPYRPRRKQATVAAAPAWYANDRVVIQDPPNFIENWAAKQAAQPKAPKLFRAFHGKVKAA